VPGTGRSLGVRVGGSQTRGRARSPSRAALTSPQQRRTVASSEAVFERIDERMSQLVSSADARADALGQMGYLPAEQVANLQVVRDSPSRSYRNAALIQLAFGIEGTEDLTERAPGGRTVAGQVGKLLASLHIPTVRDAFENIGKNQANLVRGNLPAFDDFLTWANEEATRPGELEAAFELLAAWLAELARPVDPMPELDLTKLTFPGVFGLLRRLYGMGSEGAFEQYSVAALLDALLKQSGLEGYRVETKRLTASDTSSKAAADVQVLVQNRLLEGIEVTANEYREKLAGAVRTVKEHDLGRMHIVARVEDIDTALEEAAGLAEDVSVLSLDAFASVVTAALTRPYRAVALRRLYELLDRYQTDVDKVNRFVNTVRDAGLVVPLDEAE